MAPDPDRRVITLHHFAGSGGTIIAKAIAAMGGTIVLSEIHPDRHLRGQYHPLVQLREGYGDLLDEDDLRAIDEHFVDEIELVHGIASKHGRRLVIRDHAHRDFIETDRFRSRLLDLLSDRFEPVSLVSIRDPVDCYLSQLASDSGNGPWYGGEPGEFCRRLLAFADAFADAAFLRYEDFVAEPEGAMQGLCARLGLRFDPDFQERLDALTHFTGDSGRRGHVIAPRARRELDADVARGLASSESYAQLCRRFDYVPLPASTPAPGPPARKPRTTPTFDAVAIHQMGKVGSKSLFEAVAAVGTWPCFHTHRLHPSDPFLQPGDVPVLPGQNKVSPHILRARELRSRYLDRGRPVAIVTPVREPISRNVSAFFQNLDRFVDDAAAEREDPLALYELFREEFPHSHPEEWFERQFNAPFGVDVFDHPFPDSGTDTVEADPHRLLVLKSSLSDERKSAALGGFLGVDRLAVERANETRDTGHAALYERFKVYVGRDQPYVDEMLGSRFARHFFTSKERDEIRSRWVGMG